ncbi:hypothetical protein GCM10010365_38500 [Streptomyces poonensis]|uniref:Uncharacterized protein n=1 Tax=Streptomyces poonensis TaxID=68255 RepID=A0A918PLB9_9ACTN|nr:hypothetical protein GCM10010365_38500 [Streptomyces poonensis]
MQYGVRGELRDDEPGRVGPQPQSSSRSVASSRARRAPRRVAESGTVNRCSGDGTSGMALCTFTSLSVFTPA